MAAAKCPVCGAGPMNYKTFQKHFFKNHYSSKVAKKKKLKYWKKPKMKKR